eukprot:581840-Pyramimonas_sp.AAC.1
MIPRAAMCQLGGNPYPSLGRANPRHRAAVRALTPGHHDHEPLGALILHLAPAVTTYCETRPSVETRPPRLRARRHK